MAAWADRQDGAVSFEQLIECGFSSSAIQRRCANGLLHLMLPGVYAVGHSKLGWRGKLWAAVLWGGAGTVVAHLTAATLWDLLRSQSPTVHVIVPGYRCKSRNGVRVHQARRLDPADCTQIDGLPVTTIPRTLLDIAETLPTRLERALEQAERMGKLDPIAIEQTIRRNPGRRGTKALRAARQGFDPLAPQTNEGIERDFLSLIREQGLPLPLINTLVGPYMVDYLWPEQRLIVELDSWEHHGGRLAFEGDRERDAYLQRHHKVLRVTRRRLTNKRAAVAQDLRYYLNVA